MSSTSASSRLLRIGRDHRAAVAIEFAIVLPLLLMLALPLYDYFRYIMMMQKLNKTASTISDMVVTFEPPAPGATLAERQNNPFILTKQRLENIVKTSNFLMMPFNFAKKTTANTPAQWVSIVSVYRPDARGPGIYWGYIYNGFNGDISWVCAGETAAHTTPGCMRVNMNPTNNPNNFEGTFFDSMRNGENVIITRVCADYQPIFDWNGTILPILGFAPPTPPSHTSLGDCAGKLSFVRYYPARNGPLLEIYDVPGGKFNN